MRLSLILAIAAIALLALGATTVWSYAGGDEAVSGEATQTVRLPAAAARRFLYPLEVSSNRRYLVDQRNAPFLIVGDSPQAMIGNLSLKDAAAYIANRKAAGFNSLLVDLLCVKYTGCREDGKTFDGIQPFTTPGDLSTPNPAYFTRADAMIRLMTGAGIAVFVDPIETGGWLDVLRKNGIGKAYAYGRFLGKRYKNARNLIWWNGNDFQSWGKAPDDALVLAVARGIRSVDRSHLHTVLLDYLESASLDDARWKPIVQLNSAYTYNVTYARVLKEYNRKSIMPVFLGEAGYEYEKNGDGISYGDPHTLRRQEYWALLAGAAGQFYGSYWTWPFREGWKDHLDTPGSIQVGYLVRLLAKRPWFRLVPDQAHKVVTAGYGTFATKGAVGSSNYVTTSATADGRLSLSYLPTGGTLTVDTTRFAGPVHARWYDPSNGTYLAASARPVANRGTVRFTAPGKNADGDGDWVLVLTAR